MGVRGRFLVSVTVAIVFVGGVGFENGRFGWFENEIWGVIDVEVCVWVVRSEFYSIGQDGSLLLFCRCFNNGVFLWWIVTA